MKKKLIFSAFTILLISNINAQTTINIDTSFGTNGTIYLPLIGEANYLEIIRTPDNKIIAYGDDVPKSISIHPNKIYKINLDGTLDNNFGTNGTLILPDYSGPFYVLNQGNNIIVYFNQISNNNPSEKSILRFDSNGNLDTSFGINGELLISNSHTQYDQKNIVILDDLSILVADITRYIKLTENGSYDVNYGNNGILNITNSGNILYSNSQLLNFYSSMIQGTNINGTINSNYGINGSLILPNSINNEYGFSIKQNVNNEIGIFDFNDQNKFFRINSDGVLLNNIDVTNDNNSIDYFQGFGFANNKIYFLGTTNSDPYYPSIIGYNTNGLLEQINNQNSYKELSIPNGEYYSMFNNNNELFVGGSLYLNNKHFYSVTKYKITSSDLQTNENNNKNSIIIENPIDKNFNFKSQEKINSIEIYTMEGKLIEKYNYNNISVKNIKSGIYIFKITFENGSIATKKLIKK